MRKRIISVLLCALLIVGLIPTAALAAGATDTWAVKLHVSKNSTITYNGQNTIELGFGVQSDNLSLKTAQSMIIAVDLNIFDFIAKNGTALTDSLTSSLTSLNAAKYVYSKYKDEENDFTEWNCSCYYAVSGSTGYIQLLPNQDGADEKVPTEVILASVLIGFKTGKSLSDLTSSSIRFANASELGTLNQDEAIQLTNGSDKTQKAILKDGSTDTLTVSPTVSWDGITPSKPAYSGTVDAPTVSKNTGGNVELTAQAISGETVQYGYSTSNDASAVTNWQPGTTFNGLTVGNTYYFFTRVTETAEHQAKASTGTSVVPVAATLTSITISGDTTANVPTKAQGKTTVTLTATGNYDNGSTDNITTAAAWTVDPAHAGVSVDKGTVTIQPSAAQGNVTIKAVYNGKESSHTISLNKAPATLTKLTISGDGSIHITNSTPVEKTYTVSGEDQYGESISTGSITWGIDGSASGVSIGSSDGKLKVENTASEGNVTIKATSGSIFATKTVSITKAAPAVDTVTISDGVSSLAVPAVDTLGTVKTVDAGTAFTATLKDQYGAPISGTVKWSVSGNSGVSIGLNTGLLTISSSATDADVTVTATAGNGKTDTKNVAITKATPAATFVQVKKGGTVVTTDSIVIPASGSAATTVTYTAEVYDQYGTKMTSDTPTLSITSATGVSVDSSTGKVSVERTATAGNVTLTATSSTDTSKTAAVTITLSNKPAHNIGSFTNSTMSITYGDAITGQTVGSSTGTVQYESNDPTIVSVDATGALTVHKVGTVTITAKVAEDTTYAEASTSYTVTVGQKQLEITGLTATDRDYDTTKDVALTGGTLSGKVGSDKVDAVIPTTGAMTDAKVGDNKPVTVTTPSLTGAAAGNYTLKPISGITVNIDQATPNVGTVSYAGTDTIYTSTALSAISLGMTGTADGTGNLALNGGQTLTPGTNDYDWTFTPSDTTNYKTVTGKVSLKVEEDALVSIAASGTLSKPSYKYGENFNPDGLTVTATYDSGKNRTLTSGEYTVTNGTMIMGQTEVTLTYQGKTCTVSGLTVSKADAKTLTDITVNQKYSVTTEQSKDIGRAGMPEDAGTLTYTAGSATTTGSANIVFAMDGSTVKFTITNGADTEVITLPVTIGSTNYEPSTVNVKVTLTDKDTPSVTANNITVTYDGNPIPVSKITGTATFNGSTVEGTWSFKTTAPKVVADSNDSVAVVFTPNDATAYAAVETNIKVTINKATPTGTPTYTAITTSGKKLSDAALASGSITPAGGTIAWDLGDTTDVTANTAYGWTYTPTDSANYNPLKGTITPYVVSYSGGGGGSYTPSYSITVDKTENGTITVSPKSASKGDTVTITVKPDKGYELEMLKALDKDGDALKLTEKNGKYTFKMPSGKVTVKGSFVEEAPVQIFKDVPVDAYYYEAVKWAAEKGITGGVGNGLFAPNQPCTRAQIVTFLWRAAGSPAPKNMSSFADVPADAFYAKAVAWAVENGITGGTGDGKFSPDATCTRAQSVTFLYRAAGSPKVSGSAEFGDVATNAYYADAVAWAAKNGITGGIGGGLFGSGNDCTRAQIVTFLYRSVK